MKTIHVRCSFILPVEVPDDPEYNEVFDIEENHCPGTGIVGAALTAHIKDYDKKGYCWACALKGKNEIIDPEDV